MTQKAMLLIYDSKVKFKPLNQQLHLKSVMMFKNEINLKPQMLI